VRRANPFRQAVKCFATLMLGGSDGGVNKAQLPVNFAAAAEVAADPFAQTAEPERRKIKRDRLSKAPGLAKRPH